MRLQGGIHADSKQFRTVSEEYFAAYLDNARIQWDYEPDFPGQTKKPDFVFTQDGVQVMCDVKERTPSAEQLAVWRIEQESLMTGNQRKNQARLFNPVKHVRHLIAEGRRKFKNYDGHLCALVIYSNGHRDIRLNPLTIFGAMVGNPGFQANMNCESAVVDLGSICAGYLPHGGKMVESYATMTPHKSVQNISAVVALESYHVLNPAFDNAFGAELQRETARLDRQLNVDERDTIGRNLILDGMPASIGSEWGVTVCLNPFAKIRFPDTVFNGPFDEHWEMVDGSESRIYAGEQRRALDHLYDDNDEG